MEVEIVTFVVKGKCAADRHSRSTGVNPGRKQRCYSPSCLWSQVQRDTSDTDNSQNLGYWLTIRHRCICMWSWTEMLIFSFQSRAKAVWCPLRMSTEICRLREGHNLCPLECRLSVGKPSPPPKTTKMLSTRNSSMLIMSSSVYLFFESGYSLTKQGPSRPKTRNLYLRFPLLGIKEFRMIVVCLLLSFWWGK